MKTGTRCLLAIRDNFHCWLSGEQLEAETTSESRGHLPEIAFELPGSWWYGLLAPCITYLSQPSLPCFWASINYIASWQIWHVLCGAAEFQNWAPPGCPCGNRSSNQLHWLHVKTLQKGKYNLRLKMRWQDAQSFPSLICEASPPACPEEKKKKESSRETRKENEWNWLVGECQFVNCSRKWLASPLLCLQPSEIIFSSW